MTQIEIENIIDNNLHNSEKECANEIAKLQNQQMKLSNYSHKLKELLPKLVEAFNQIGLEIKNYNHVIHCHNAWHHYNQNERLDVDLQLQPNSNKFRFIKFAGYTAIGTGKNEKLLNAKTSKLKKEIKEKTGVNIGVNPYSLEYKLNSKNKFVMVNFSID